MERMRAEMQNMIDILTAKLSEERRTVQRLETHITALEAEVKIRDDLRVEVQDLR